MSSLEFLPALRGSRRVLRTSKGVLPLPLSRRFLIFFPAFLSSLILVSAADAGVVGLSGDDLHCHVTPAHDPSPAEKAYLDGKASEAESLYREALSKSPHDATLTAGLVRSLLREQKVEDAASTVNAELVLAPNSVPLLTALAEVQYRQGKIAEAAGTADQAYRIDPCNPRLYLLRARILRLNSVYLRAQRHRHCPRSGSLGHGYSADLAGNASPQPAHR